MKNSTKAYLTQLVGETTATPKASGGTIPVPEIKLGDIVSLRSTEYPGTVKYVEVKGEYTYITIISSYNGSEDGDRYVITKNLRLYPGTNMGTADERLALANAWRAAYKSLSHDERYHLGREVSKKDGRAPAASEIPGLVAKAKTDFAATQEKKAAKSAAAKAALPPTDFGAVADQADVVAAQAQVVANGAAMKDEGAVLRGMQDAALALYRAAQLLGLSKSDAYTFKTAASHIADRLRTIAKDKAP